LRSPHPRQGFSTADNMEHWWVTYRF
jgi:hypothetical protein